MSESIGHCAGEVCVTCSDEAVPARIVRLLPGDLALADTDTTREEISVALVEAEVGAVVLVHAKEAIALITEPANTAADGGGS